MPQRSRQVFLKGHVPYATARWMMDILGFSSKRLASNYFDMRGIDDAVLHVMGEWDWDGARVYDKNISSIKYLDEIASMGRIDIIFYNPDLIVGVDPAERKRFEAR
jgi:hypothetical protein